LAEQNFIKNIKHVIGYDCPFFGKLLYLYLSGGKDKCLITLPVYYRFMAHFQKDEDYKR